MPAIDHLRAWAKRRAAHTAVVALCLFVPAVSAYPPAPPHTLFGTVRDSFGTPYQSPAVNVVLLGADNLEKARTLIDPLAGVGINYSLLVAMDAGLTGGLYDPTAMRPTLPFTLRVEINGVSYLPIQMSVGSWTMGRPAERRRIDLTVGVDSDGDGLPDAWEWDLIFSDTTGRLRALADVRPGDDFDGDGLTNQEEYLAGTYAFDTADALSLAIVEIIAGGRARLQFLAITGRTYTIESSADLVTWTEQPFALTPSGATSPSFRATDVRPLDVYAPSGPDGRTFFRLNVH